METKSLNQITKELEYFDLMVTVQNKPYRYNWISIPINENIQIILNWINKKGESASSQELQVAFDLLRKYTTLLEKFYKNHPWKQ